jgi:hypothetical protein
VANIAMSTRASTPEIGLFAMTVLSPFPPLTLKVLQRNLQRFGAYLEP